MATRKAIYIATAILCASCAQTGTPGPQGPGVQSARPRAAIGSWGVALTNMDRNIKPGDDFFSYVNGAWFKTVEIPADRTTTGGFQDLAILSEQRMKLIIDEIETKKLEDLSAEEHQLRDLYDAFTDVDGIEKAGFKPAAKELKYFASLKTLKDVSVAMGSVEHRGDSIFGSFVAPDAKNPTSYVMILAQAGLGLPDRDYYLRDDKALADTRSAYKSYLKSMFELAGLKKAGERADKVFALETEIAKTHWARADRRDADKAYNPMTISELEKLAPGFEWRAFFAAENYPVAGSNGERKIIVRENTGFPALAKVFAATPVAVWRDYLTVHYLHAESAYLPKRFDDADFAFYGKVLSGQARPLPRETRAVRLLDQRLGHPLGKIYVTKYFPPEAKAKVDAMVGNILKAYDADIREIPWMTPATKQRALDKLHAFRPHIGYPDRWRDYSGLAIKREELLASITRSDAFEWNYRLNRLDSPVNRDEWSFTPPTINANYSAVFNGIFFPAAILQPPFFDPNADDAVNYGGIGAVIGHEISHGFDDQGSKFTGSGVLENWWTADDRKAFEARTQMLVDQYSSYEGLPGLNVNGRLTLGENIGDLSGLTMSYKAYKIAQAGKSAVTLDGFTPDQRFFLGFGQIWRAKVREGMARTRLLSDPHSPPNFRVDGTARNIDAWYKAFDVKDGEKYYLPADKRVRLW